MQMCCVKKPHKEKGGAAASGWSNKVKLRPGGQPQAAAHVQAQVQVQGQAGPCARVVVLH
jgi:hypothetical protein